MADRTIDYIALDQIVEWDANPKDHDIAALIASMRRFGFQALLLLNDQTGVLLAGHGRLHALSQMLHAGEQIPDGIGELNGQWLVPVVRGSQLSAQEAIAYSLADNRLVELGGWHEEDLAGLLVDLAEDDVLEGTGWSAGDLDGLLRDLAVDEPQQEARRRDLFAGYMDSFEEWISWMYTYPISVWDGNSPAWLARKRKLMKEFFAEFAGASRLDVGPWEDPQLSSRQAPQGSYGGASPLWQRRPVRKAGASKVGLRHAQVDPTGHSFTSLFDPVLAEVICKAYTSGPGARIYDPFGGDIRGIIAAGHGYEYVGVELRKEQVAVVDTEAERLGLLLTMICGDSSQEVGLADGWANLAFSCPPYGDLERYSDDPADLSYQAAQDYNLFLGSYQKALSQTFRILASPGFMVLVIGNFVQNGVVRDFRSDTSRIAQVVGFEEHDEVIYRQPLGTAPARAYSFRVNRRTLRNHEYVLVFRKGELDDFRPRHRAHG